ncbi:methylmalonyl-CoA mutase family protein [Coralliovum pocilloporae]|uniref:methylmalonyl-CoA mutase family protein n=1 Tax=Coralliovum pocilloporae TaxID=3066369 RepID=UPI003307BE91
MTTSGTSFTNDFPSGNRELWTQAVEKALKGRSADSLQSRTYDAISIHPIYERAQGTEALSGRPDNAPWQVVQRVDHFDTTKANHQALIDLENGCSTLALVFASSPAAYGFGLPRWDSTVFSETLADIELTAIDLHLDGGWNSRRVADSFAEWVGERGLDASSLSVTFNLDPLGALAATGILAAPWDDVAPKLAATTQALAEQGFKGPFAVADGRPYHAAGATDGQEVGILLATALAYLRAFEAAGIALDDAAGWISFTIALDADQFAGIAKIRALKLGWARILQASGISGVEPRIHTETAWRMMTRRDPYVNMLRVTTATFAAAVAGANSLTVLPFTQALGLPDEFARRVARNTHLILSEESNLHKVCDPVAGSGFTESLTDDIGAAAWSLLQSIETEGGVANALISGSLQTAINSAVDARDRNIARRKDELTGVSAFPNIAEAPVTVESDAVHPAFLPEPDVIQAAPLEARRLAEPFEALREAAEETGETPEIFLANLGTIAQFTARSTWIKNLFETGGIKAPGNDGFDSSSAATEAFKASGARLVCLCSSDTVYETLAEETARALKQAGASHIYLAGKPGDNETALREAGVDGFVYAGANILDLLNEAHDLLSDQPSGE